MSNTAMKQKIHNRLNFLLIATSEQSTTMDTIIDLFLFLLRYPFLLNNASNTQNSRVQKTPQLNVPQGNIYMGARYLDPKYSRWISVDPALGEYIPAAGKGNSENAGNLPGMGGIYNHINGDLYHYAGNNPVRYMDPDGRNVKNNTNVPITVRTEHGYYIVLEPGDEYVGRQDGILLPEGTTYKCNTFANVTVTSKNNKYKFSGSGLLDFFTNIIKGIWNFFAPKEKDKDYNKFYDKKFPVEWWKGNKEFTSKDFSDHGQKPDFVKLHPIDDGSKELSNSWKEISDEVNMEAESRKAAKESEE